MMQAAEALMQRYDVRGSGPQARMASLSGGNQQKAVLARELSIAPLVFLLAAQPTRGCTLSPSPRSTSKSGRRGTAASACS